MLELKNITKEYKTGAEVVHALRGVSLAFRKSEFVSILGPSGCGKTTMLNILGGLDQYTSGDLVIDGISTKEYKDADWDAYRNDTIGFVFQSYNLISHQTVLANVELALTLSGVSASERRRRAIAALEQVGLGDQITKKPAQMSGGQVQRVAIARALINDPDIILADEPTGALDSETSLQIMAILKDIASRKLVIMVTHNPELAETYSTRIVRLSDGQVLSDSNPYVPGMPDMAKPQVAAASALADTLEAAPASSKPGRRASGRRNKSMSMKTALQLSLNNLMTKKARTLLTAFAGSIGIIGIALILSVSNGFQTYIDKLEEDTLSSYPLTIQSETADMTSMITAFAANVQDTKGENSGDKIHEQQVMTDMLASIGSNDLAAFKEEIDSNMDMIGPWLNDYSYNYGISPTIYSTDLKYGPLRVSPGSIFQSYMSGMQSAMVSYSNTDVFFQMMNNQDLLKSQYKVLAGKWPEKYDELLLVLDSEDQINDYIVYTLGLRDPQELKDMIDEVMKGNEVDSHEDQLEWTYDDFIGMEFALINNCDTYVRNSSYDVWEDHSDDDEFMEDLIRDSEKIHISGIVCAKERNGALAMSTGIGYLPSLKQHMIDYAAESEIVKIQRANKDVDVFSGKSFEDIRNKTDEGLGFDDMISIDEDKLRKAFGGSMDMNALQKSIRKTGDDELKKLTAADSAEKIMEDVNTALSTGCNGMVNYIIEQYNKDPATFDFNKELVDMAFSKNLDKGKHNQIVNPLLNGYGEVLKAAGPQIMQGLAAATSPEAAAAAKAQAQQAAAAELIKNLPEGTGLTEEVILGILQDTSEENQAAWAATLVEQSQGAITEEQAAAIAQQVFDAAKQANARIDEQMAQAAVDPAEMLRTMLAQTVSPYLNANQVQDGIKQYGQGIEMMQMAQEVYPALGKVAQAVGKQFNVDPSGIAEAFQMKMDEDEITRLITAYISGDEGSSYEGNLRELGFADLAKPSSMSFYLKDFESKENFLKFIDDYNARMQDNGDENLVISYTDITGVMMKSVKTITNAVSYVLIAFVAISLIVSSIMIGVITYISVLERTKEIGILRAIGASKRDISRIFNAETIIVGLCAGVIGIGASLLLLIPINNILIGLTGIQSLRAILPPAGGVILILISIFLTFIAGLIPSGMAARKDPVVALRTE
ncbi:MAG: ABC transporter ATP-binding protein/permease [Mogibacterium sp.]|nr:ABC transporter ATP-binding protein/permease [Mogibacterium sp.]